jgi:BirA family biotin operon repressor/biotin-[acetyl-CoA-carboxylase] ligase
VERADLVRCEQVLRARGRAVRVFETTGSTNDDAKAWAAEGAPHGAVVVADAQERGRGRHGRAWSTPPGESLALSVVLRPNVAPSQLPPIALVAGLAARAAVGARVEGALVKWPNDVWVAGRKIAGVLVEGSIAGSRVDHVVVGVGINVARTEFPPELHATSLALAGASDLDRGALAIDLLDALDRELDAWLAEPSSIASRLAPHDALRGRAVTLEDGTRGTAAGIEPDGRLRVECEGTVRLAHAGEVRVA